VKQIERERWIQQNRNENCNSERLKKTNEIKTDFKSSGRIDQRFKRQERTRKMRTMIEVVDYRNDARGQRQQRSTIATPICSRF
jgi:methyl coenzyme M reductase subunit C-like uncharacterized protein (methanogenesis marker protein 7)